MKLVSRIVIEDCKLACNELKIAEETNDKQLIKIRWFTCITLLRSVGHILKSVDEDSLPQFKEIFKKQFNEKKNDSIFKDFIKVERDLIIKEYKDFIKEEEQSYEENLNIVFNTGEGIELSCGGQLVTSQTFEVKRFFKKGPGLYSGDLLHGIILLAINWWEEYITSIENECKKKIT